MSERGPNPSGLCMCGCGNRTKIASRTSRRRGTVKGMPGRYIHGHNGAMSPVEYVVDAVSGCWVWQRTRTENGYGRTTLAGRTIYAHRLYYERFEGPIPKGMCIDHLCRNRACVNPEHLEAVTNAENLRRGNGTRLTPDQVDYIRQSSTPAKKLAARYGVSLTAIYAIRKGVTWERASSRSAVAA